MERTALLMFVKWPEEGRVKTRLAATLGARAACRIHRFLAERNFYAARLTPEVRLVVCGTGATPDQFRVWLPGASDYWSQPEGDLGARLEAMFARAFDQFSAPVIAIGSDCGELTSGTLRQAARDLADGADVLIIPANDGGYVLIGMSLWEPRLFQGMPWSTEDLMPATIRCSEELGLDLKQGSPLPDVDTEDDWKAFCEAHPEIHASGIVGADD